MAPADAESTARAIVARLREAGYVAYFAGGCVRDRLLGVARAHDDYDVATSARPEEVQRLFPRTVAVGAQFGVILVIEGDVRVEVATFRADDAYVDGRHPVTVRFTTPEEDAARRDFTINGMFADPFDGRVLDFVGGRRDLEQSHRARDRRSTPPLCRGPPAPSARRALRRAPRLRRRAGDGRGDP